MRRLVLVLALLVSVLTVQPAIAASGPFDGWSFDGVTVAANDARLAGGASSGTMSSPPVSSAKPFEQLIGSWNAVTPAGTWLEVRARLLQAPGWSPWYGLGVWASDGQRHSVDGQRDERAAVDTDTLLAAPGLPASGYQLSVALNGSASGSPTVRLVKAATSSASKAEPGSAWGVDVPVPQRSQMLAEYRELGFGGGGEAWCSPTSTSMVMAYWANVLNLPQLDVPVPTAAAGTYDYAYRGAGNWPFNTAFAGSYGLTAYVARFGSLAHIEPWIRAGVPIVISVSFRPGELAGAPIASTPGHLLVVRGFTPRGDVIMNDPAAASDAQVRMVYDRGQLERAWLNGSRGTAYVIYPPGWVVPTEG